MKYSPAVLTTKGTLLSLGLRIIRVGYGRISLRSKRSDAINEYQLINSLSTNR